MIAKTIHYIWLGDINKLTGLKGRCIASWSKYLPEFEQVLWDEANIRNHFTEQELVFFERMLRRKKYAFAADYVRCLVLEKFGGIYLDTDVEVIRDFSPLLNCQAFLGLEDINRPNCAVFGAVQGLPFITELKHIVIQAGGFIEMPVLAGNVLFSKQQHVCDVTQPVLIDSVCVYPERYFYPYNPYKANSAGQLLYDDIKQETFAIHHWEKTWKFSFIELLIRFIKRKFIV